jgi:hypothetical protein
VCQASPLDLAETARDRLLVLDPDLTVRFGLRLLGAAIDELRKAKFVQYLTAFLGAFAEALAGAGRIAQGLAAIDEALAQSERNEERWCVPEFLRIKGELILREGSPQAVKEAEQHFRHSIGWARQQGVLLCELRTSTSLARLQQDQHRSPKHAAFCSQPTIASSRALKLRT